MANNEVSNAFLADREVKANRSVKLKNKNAEQSEKAKQERAEIEAKFNNAADNYLEHQDDKNRRAISVISKFLQVCNDKTIVKNKGAIAKEVEESIRNELIKLAIDLNNDDEEERAGMGSVALLTVFAKIILNQRDRLNELEYQFRESIKKASTTGTNG